MYKILVINTGSTSTKVAFYDGKQAIVEQEIAHDAQELASCGGLLEQIPCRAAALREAVQESIAARGLDAVAARGGTFGRVHGGAYLVDEQLLEACRKPRTNHASNLSAILAGEIADAYGCPAYIYDAVCTDEVEEIARYSGLHDVPRRTMSHTLNTRAAAIRKAKELGCDYSELTCVVAHLGGGCSINLHRGGRIVDLVSDDEGTMSPERAGKLNTKSLLRLCFSGVYDQASLMKRLQGAGGLMDHLGTSDLREVEARIEAGDDKAAFLLQVMAYQVGKDVAGLASVVQGELDAILLTGGCARSRRLTDAITGQVSWLAPVTVYPGAMEMEALRDGITRVLEGVEAYAVYQGGKA